MDGFVPSIGTSHARRDGRTDEDLADFPGRDRLPTGWLGVDIVGCIRVLVEGSPGGVR